MLAFIALSAALIVMSVSAQNTEFTFQGSLRDGGSSAGGNYDFEILLGKNPVASASGSAWWGNASGG